jgi:hypothetical protein
LGNNLKKNLGTNLKIDFKIIKWIRASTKNSISSMHIWPCNTN